MTFTIEDLPPSFNAVTPADGTIQSAATVTLTGHLSGAVQLTVNSQPVPPVGDAIGADFVAGPYALAEGETAIASPSAGRSNNPRRRRIESSGPVPSQSS